MQLNLEQNKMIENKTMGHAIIKGVVGSGKTTVGVNRTLFLMKNYCIDKNDRVLLVTYNKSLVSYIKHIYKEAQAYNDDMNLLNIGGYDDKRLDIVNIDSLIFKYAKKYMDSNNYQAKLIEKKEELEVLKTCILKLRKKYEDVAVLNDMNVDFLLKELIWLKACNYMELETYQNIDRIGRSSSDSGDGPKKLLKNSRTRQAIFELFQLYRKETFDRKLCDFNDNALMTIKYFENHDYQKYTHIIIDESQDLSKVQLDVITSIYDKEKDYASILFIADTAQSIYETAWLVKGRNFTSIGFDMTGKSKSLSKNYRTTTQIAQTAYSLIDADSNIVSDDNFVKPSLIDRKGTYPILRGFMSAADEREYIYDLIINTLDKKYDRKDIAIVARTRKMIIEMNDFFKTKNLSSAIFLSNKDFDFNEESIKLITMHSIKGLEFKVVILMGLNDQVIPNINSINSCGDENYVDSMERKLLYVGMTRANEELYMSYSGKGSKFLYEINNKFLKINNKTNFSRYYDIRTDNYMFKDKLADLYSNEEKVRQWFLHELINNYKYRVELIEIEKRVNIFSRTGAVDIAVNIYKNGKFTPYIFVECKKISGLNEAAKNQLKSYMAVESSVVYGILTDGNELRIYDREMNEIEDIPKFDLSMMPTSLKQLQYIDFKHNKRFDFIVDDDVNEKIIEVDNEKEKVIASDRLCKMNLFDKIACGKPIDLTGEVEGCICIPDDWVGNHEKNEIFAVNTFGDSMKDASIEEGDIVVIKSQNYAENNDIVAVDLDGNVTLKRFWKMGSQGVLKPENSDYEPIMLQLDEIRVIGKAIGVIKEKY